MIVARVLSRNRPLLMVRLLILVVSLTLSVESDRLDRLSVLVVKDVHTMLPPTYRSLEMPNPPAVVSDPVVVEVD